MNHKNQYFVLEIVATKKASRFKWKFEDDKKKQYCMKQHYKIYPNRFIEIDNVLHFKSINKDRLKKLREACLEIAGNSYVLAVDLAGKRDLNLYKAILQQEGNRYEKAVELFFKYERYLKNYGIASGVIVDEKIKWLPSHILNGYRPNVLRKYWEKDKKFFCVVENVLYYLKPKNILIEELFFEACEIAGGERNLALALSKNEQDKLKHESNFLRLRFKKRDNFVYYTRLLAHYIESNI